MAHFAGQSNSKTEVANRERFISEFSLPEGTADKLAEAEGMGIYPPDHVHTFKGNIDDNFRAGIRVMKKALKLFETFYGSDLIVASPLGLRLAIEREGNSDFLSSIEILVIDQADVMTMQNWTHLQFVFEHLNKLPKDPRDTDFSRVKSWFLDGHAPHLRQNILISSYETPQIRALFNDTFRNIAGKVRFERRWPGVEIPEGIKQSFVKFECSNGRDEADARFEYFTKEFFPSLKKSAVLSANTLLFIPSYFDFIRVRNWMKQNASVSVAFISEESSKSEIDRARAQFMKGQKAFLVITERFHFFRRYRIKGVLNVIFYGPPDHANFYSELLTYPFFKKDVEPSEVTFPMDLILTIFLLVLLTQAISWIGQSVLLDLAYALYQRLFNGAKVAQQRSLKTSILNTKKELLETSAQDQFAKWAKLRRKIDKELAELEKLNSELGSAKTAFSIKFHTAIWILTTGAQMVLGWWYRKTPVFYLPKGWFGPFTWWLSLPFAPAGSVSCGAWQMACKRVITMMERVVRDLYDSAEEASPQEPIKQE
ncbi:rRNA-binding ribosome biosynthesis protein utp25 [Tulasnella sp. UAMH 9824]|nr:rRNA-binding ribosome biosynthesis protein utp25 [Tulasnella sp. UAMH 9824]